MTKNEEAKTGGALPASHGDQNVLERIAFILTWLIGRPYIVERVFGQSQVR
jgi:hypothetical protein